MGNCIITLRSETYSQRAGKLLRENGIQSSVVRLGGEYSANGCGHGVKFDCKSKAQVVRLMKENGIPFSDIKAL